MSLRENLLEPYSSIQSYNPYENPPSLQRALDHQNANKVGLDPQQDNDNIKLCICCGNVIDKKEISLTCQDEDLLFLGVGYPLYFKLGKYFGLILAFVFVISGSGFFLLTALNCEKNCMYFMSVPVINYDQVGHKATKIPDFVHFVISLLILALCLLVRTRIQSQVFFLQEKVVSPEQYTIIIQNLPEQTTEQQISDWSKSKFGVKPIVVNFAYNLSELQDAFEQRKVISIKLNRLQIRKDQAVRTNQQTTKNLMSEFINDLTEKVRKYDLIIDHYKHENINCRKIGTALLTYQQQKYKNEICKKYQSTYYWLIYHRVLRMVLPNLYRRSTKNIKYDNEDVVLHNAPAPREIIWENLSFSFPRYILTQLVGIAAMVILLMVAFRIQLEVGQWQYELRKQDMKQQKTQDGLDVFDLIQSMSMTLMIMLVNLLLRELIKAFVNFKKHYSYSRYESSFCFYYSLMSIFNTCFMIYIVHLRHDPRPSQLVPSLSAHSRDSLLIYDIHLLLVFNSMFDPIYKIANPFMWFRVLWRRHVSALPAQRNPYTQAYVNELYEQYEVSNVDNYQYIWRVLVVTIWFAHAAPLGVLIAMAGYTLDYWVTKVMLLRMCKRPQNISKRIVVPMIKALPFIPFVYLCGVLQFTYKVSDSPGFFTFMFDFLDYLVVILILLCIIGSFYFWKAPPSHEPSSNRYDEIEIIFESNYDTENPMYKLKNDMKYAVYKQLKKSALKASGNQNTKNVFNELMSLNSQSQPIISDRQNQILKIKRKKLKKLQTIEIELTQAKQNSKQWRNQSFQRKSSSSESSQD